MVDSCTVVSIVEDAIEEDVNGLLLVKRQVQRRAGSAASRTTAT
jgi:hypothetical protein